MLLEDVLIVLAILLFVAAVAFELRRDRDKKMYVGGEAKTKANEGSPENLSENSTVSSNKGSSVPVVRTEPQPPVVTQEELKTPKKSA